jgi:WD40 repeat protein
LRILKATPEGLHKIRKARQEKDWAIDNPQWLEEASKFLPVVKYGKRKGAGTVSIGTWKRFLKGEGVRPQYFQAFCQVLGLNCEEVVDTTPTQSNRENNIAHPHQDWGEAPDTSMFYGRTEELSTLEQWIVKDRCKLVLLLAQGGMGKTTLSVKLAQQIKHQFQYVIWRSLRESPPIEKILADLIKILSNQQDIDLPETVGEKIMRLIHYLRSSHCLLVLDNAEAILQSGTRAGYYREGYEGYGELFQRVGEVAHQSCLIVTSREPSKEVRQLAGETLPVRILELTGLKAEAKEILTARGIAGCDREFEQLIECYHGNPLALQVVPATIKKTFNGSIASFLETGKTVFGDIDELLTAQFDRLSEIEKSLMYWLAINREQVSLAQLQDDIVPRLSEENLIEALDSLAWRSLIQLTSSLTPLDPPLPPLKRGVEEGSNSPPFREKKASSSAFPPHRGERGGRERGQGRLGFTLQNVVMEYVTARFVKQIIQELQTSKLHLLKTHALIKAQAKDYIRETQIRLILKPVLDYFLKNDTESRVEQQFLEIIAKLRNDETTPRVGYAGGNILNLLVQCKTNLNGYDFSHLTIWQAYLQGVNLHQVNFAYSNLEKSVFSQSLGSIFSVAFSPDCQLLATGGADGQIRIWQVSDGKQLMAWQAHGDWIRSVAFSFDGKAIASGSNDRTVRIWDSQTGDCLKILRGHTDWVWSVSFIFGGHLLVSASSDHTARIWELNTGFSFTLREPEDQVWSAAFSNNGYTLATGSATSVKLWNVWTRQYIKTLQDNATRVRALSFSPDGKTLIGSSDDRSIKTWDVDSGKCLQTLTSATTTRLWSVKFSPDGEKLISGSADTIQIWNLANGECLMTLQEPHHRARSITCTPDGQIIAVGSDDQLIRLWDTRTGKPLRTLQGYINRIWTIAFHPIRLLQGDFFCLASGSDDGIVRLWDVKTGQCLKTLLGHTNRIRSVALSPDGQILASGSHDRTIKLWDVSTGQCLKTLRGHVDWVVSVMFSTNNRTLISAGDDQTVLVWDTHTNESQLLREPEQEWMWAFACHPKYEIVATGGSSNTVNLWNIQTKRCLTTLKGHKNRIRAIAFNTSGKILASSSDDLTLRLWNWQTRRCLGILSGHKGQIRSLTFIPASSKRSEILVSSGDDRTIRLWDIYTGNCLKILKSHLNPIWSVCYSPELDILFSCSEDETIKLWDIESGNCIKTFRVPRPYKGTNITSITGLTEAQKATLKALGAVEDRE